MVRGPFASIQIEDKGTWEMNALSGLDRTPARRYSWAQHRPLQSSEIKWFIDCWRGIKANKQTRELTFKYCCQCSGLLNRIWKLLLFG